MVDVCPATWPIRIEVAALAIPGILWCSAIQKREKPQRSASRARSIVLANASAIVPPSRTGARSSTENRGAGESGIGRLDASTQEYGAECNHLITNLIVYERQHARHVAVLCRRVL